MSDQSAPSSVPQRVVYLIGRWPFMSIGLLTVGIAMLVRALPAGYLPSSLARTLEILALPYALGWVLAAAVVRALRLTVSDGGLVGRVLALVQLTAGFVIYLLLDLVRHRRISKRSADRNVTGA